MEQHLQLLAMGEPILKPLYNHQGGTLERPVLIEPTDNVIVEGLLPLHNRIARACFDLSVYLDPPEEIRRRWKANRDTHHRGYTEAQVLAELEKREPESAAFTSGPNAGGPTSSSASLPSRSAERPRGAPLSATILLRPTAPHPDLSAVLGEGNREAIHLKLIRDEDRKPVDALHVHAYASRETTRRVEEAIWTPLGVDSELPESLGVIDNGIRSEALAVVQLILLCHLELARRLQGPEFELAP